MTLRAFSSGGGVQSTAALVLSAQGRIDFPIHLFSNVGDDSEHPDTLRYVREVLMPYAEAHGIEYHELRRVNSRGKHKGEETLYGRLTRPGSRSLPIPVRMSNGAPGTRSCTVDFKLRVVAKWHQQRGATEENPSVTGIGFSTDEIERKGKARRRPWEIVEYPLLDDLGLSRAPHQDRVLRSRRSHGAFQRRSSTRSSAVSSITGGLVSPRVRSTLVRQILRRGCDGQSWATLTCPVSTLASDSELPILGPKSGEPG